MQLMRLADVPVSARDQVFCYSRGRAICGTITLLGFILGAFVYGQLMQSWLYHYLGAITLFFLWLFRKLILARFHPSNWLVRMSDDGLWIKFRSYLNDHFPAEDLTVVFLAFAEIRSAKFVRERQEIPDTEERGRPTSSIRTRKYVELELAADCQQLTDELAHERERVMGRVTGITTRYHDTPVFFAARDRLRVEWNVVPKAPAFLDAMTRHILVQPAERSSKDLADFDGLSQKEQEAKLLELAQSGDKIGAIAMARRLYSYDLAAAKQFVEELLDKPTRN
jgi:hypothetical protein